LADAQPTVIGWRSLKDESKAQLDLEEPFHRDSRRFEIATSCVPLLAGLRCSLKLLEKEGNATDRLLQIRHWSAQLWNELNNIEGVELLLNGAPPAGLVSFALPQGPATKEVVKQLGQQGIWIRDLADPNCLRACLNITSTADELISLSDAIIPLASCN